MLGVGQLAAMLSQIPNHPLKLAVVIVFAFLILALKAFSMLPPYLTGIQAAG